jgi:hypothetical protein
MSVIVNSAAGPPPSADLEQFANLRPSVGLSSSAGRVAASAHAEERMPLTLDWYLAT